MATTFPAKIESTMLDYQGEINDGKVWESVPTREINIIRTDQDWGIKLEWVMSGLDALMSVDEWHVSLFLESTGSGPEYDLPSGGPIVVLNQDPVVSTFDPVTGERTFKLTITIDHTVDPIAPGTYWLTSTLQYYFVGTNNPWPCAGFFEGPMLQFYKPI